MGLEVGDKIPDLVLKDTESRDVNLRELVGKGKLIISFYRGEWWPHCRIYLKSWRDAAGRQKLGEIGVTFVAVSVDTVDETRNVKVEDALPFMLLSDVDLKATIAFGVLDKLRKREPRYIPVPATFIVDEVGFIRYMQAVNHPHEDFRPSVEELRRIIEALSR